MENVRVRFAPSPTGPLHIGGARSALFNWLFARRYNGTMIVRVEDTDLDRSTLEYEELILDSLRWLGIDWDEGITVGGDNGPYRQRERLDIYQPYVDKLLESGQAYHCYCSEEELEAERQELSAKGELPRYLGKCRDLSIKDKEEKCALGVKPVVRFRVPEGQQIVVDDMVRGRVSFDSDGIGDYIIVKSDGIPTYNFAVVLDDALMKVSHILRGEEHLSNTPRQILLYEALAFELPRFAHISLILGEDRSKMSKRHGATSVVQYRNQGYLPEALVNFLALLGWSPEGEEEIFSIEELTRLFSLERVSKSPAVFNFAKLKWMNSHYIKEESVERIFPLCLPHLQQAGLAAENPTAEDLDWLKQVVGAVKDKLEYAAQITEHAAAFFGEEPELDQEDEDAKAVLALETSPAVIAAFRQKALELQEWDGETVKAILKGIGKEQGVKGKALFMTVRVAVSGRSQGPDLNALLTLLGPQQVARRLEYTLKQL
ncbi:glutamate--tRNA ligase [Dethiobacter alkaliphilus]|uniref:Glutamate--tRNA ligase n=1 Tax=Dethiobacter alkaliphilus AHT 1 TaxID=555088 RepID=C0GIM5_DETAL|nr:glutamate--tRNA ligase [Dethiobacter alkaliphilus]EEG76886.1 glutamyl-tRNA synthetase [Dethiobacter alkaliphilus AHT 1]